MRSVSAKIMLWSVGALVLSLAVFILVGQVVVGSTLMEGLTRFNDFHFQEARAAYESGGKAALSSYLDKLERSVGVRYHLIDASGNSVLTGQDQSARLRRGERQWRMRAGNEALFGVRSADGRYFWVGVIKPPFSVTVFAPFYLIILAAVGAVYWLVATQVANPLRRLAGVVERFGGGELGTRAVSGANDEIGALGRSFNSMADRIQTLLAAERQLLQDVSHELRSPLGRLTFEAEMVRRTNDRDASATRLRHEIERLSELVGSLIDMARAEGEPAAVEMEDVCINNLLDNIAEDCVVEASARGCNIVASPADLVRLRCNAELLHRAFENVIRNAIRYSPPGTTVEIELLRNGNNVTVSVRDHGPGIQEEMLSRIFDPFFRLDAARESSTGGLGLGLAIARRAVRAHHGDITAKNVHPGALIEIVIPAVAG